MLLESVPPNLGLAVIVCTHLHPADEGRFARFLHERSALPVVEACDKQPIRPGVVYVAPAQYHLLVERQRTLALSTDERVRFSRPSIDVLFESAAHAYKAKLIGLLLSGANDDGADGLAAIRRLGGFTVAQDPTSAEYPEMPQIAIGRGAVCRVARPDELPSLIIGLAARLHAP